MGDQRWWGSPGQAVNCLGVVTHLGGSDNAVLVMGLSVRRQRPAAERGLKELGFCWGGYGQTTAAGSITSPI